MSQEPKQENKKVSKSALFTETIKEALENSTQEYMTAKEIRDYVSQKLPDYDFKTDKKSRAILHDCLSRKPLFKNLRAVGGWKLNSPAALSDEHITRTSGNDQQPSTSQPSTFGFGPSTSSYLASFEQDQSEVPPVLPTSSNNSVTQNQPISPNNNAAARSIWPGNSQTRTDLNEISIQELNKDAINQAIISLRNELYQVKRNHQVAMDNLRRDYEKKIVEAKMGQWCLKCVQRRAAFYCCRQAQYCSFECQHDDWHRHRTVCQYGVSLALFPAMKRRFNL